MGMQRRKLSGRNNAATFMRLHGMPGNGGFKKKSQVEAEMKMVIQLMATVVEKNGGGEGGAAGAVVESVNAFVVCCAQY